MAKPEQYYKEYANDLIKRDRDLIVQMEGMDRMVHLEYQLPEGLRTLQWMRNVRVTAPYDAYKASRQVLSGLNERITFFPYSDSEKDRGLANQFEHVLRWNFNLASKRRASFREDIIGSAVLYDRIVGQVVHIPTQLQNLKEMGASTRRHEAAMRYGPFAILLHNPKNVHLVYSEYMLEAVFLHVVQTAQEIVDFWGSANAALIADKIREDPTHANEKYILCDWVDFDERFIWAVHGDRLEALQDSDIDVTLRKEDYTLNFLPWVAEVGGNAIDDKPEYQSQPLLFPVYQAEQWATANIVASLATSQSIAEMGRPRIKKTGPGAGRIRAEYGTPAGAWIIEDLQSDVTDMGDKPLDPALKETWMQFISDMERATLPRVLLNAEGQPGEAFAGFNLRIQTAIGKLLPYKRLAERWYERVLEQMILWSSEREEALEGYEYNNRGVATGKRLTIPANKVDPERLFIKVELSPDVPTDRVQRVTAAINMSERLKIPIAHVLEELGITDPQRAIKDWMREQIIFAVLQGRLTEIADATSGRLQSRAMQLAQQFMEQQQQQQGGGGEGALPVSPNGSPEQLSMFGGGGAGAGVLGAENGFNPAAGEISAAEASPAGAAFEGATGTDRTGAELGALLGLGGR